MEQDYEKGDISYEETKENGEDNIYEEDSAEEQLEQDEIKPSEAGFIEGYENPNLIHCKKCKKKIEGLDLEKCHEKKVDGTSTWMCEECCDTIEKKK